MNSSRDNIEQGSGDRRGQGTGTEVNHLYTNKKWGGRTSWY